MPNLSLICLTALKSKPLQTATVKFLKPMPIWIGNYQMRNQSRTTNSMHQLFEPHTSTENDVVLVNGNRETFLVRNGFKWPVRFLGESSNTRLMMIFSPESRLGMSRVKPIQNAIFNEVMTITSIHTEPPSLVAQDGLQLIVADRDAMFWISQCDLIKCCEFSPEWRFTKLVPQLNSSALLA